MSNGTKDSFVKKGVDWYRGIWSAPLPGGGWAITAWAVVRPGQEAEVIWNPLRRRSDLHIRVQEGDEDWPAHHEGVKLIDRCRAAWKLGRPVEVILRDGDRDKDEADEARISPSNFACRITYVGSAQTGDLGTIRGEFMTEAEYRAVCSTMPEAF